MGIARDHLIALFARLAWSLIVGLLASTVFTLFVIPVAYWLIYAQRPGHGLQVAKDGQAMHMG